MLISFPLEEIQEEYRCVGIYHAPAVASDKDDAVVQDGAARPAAALQDGRLQDVPLVGLGVVTLHQHYI